MKAQITMHHLISIAASVCLIILILPAEAGNKPRFQYIGIPNTVIVDSMPTMEICLVNQGDSGDLINDGSENLDHINITIPLGQLGNDLTNDTTNFVITDPSQWASDVVIEQAEILITLKPDGVVTVGTMETICFNMGYVNINSEVGLSLFNVDQQLDSKRADAPINDLISIFKSTSSVAGSVEIDPTVADSLKDGISWDEIENIPADIDDGDDVGITSESDPTVAAQVKDGVDWSELTGIPLDFADNIDNDSGGDITAVFAGTGLYGGGIIGDVLMNVDTTAIQSRIIGTCPEGSFIREITQSGQVTCETDNFADTDWVESDGNVFRLDGNVGIGTPIPTSTLELERNDLSDLLIEFDHNEATMVSTNFMMGISGTGIEAPYGDFYVKSAGGAKVVINNAGNLGIGTTTPEKKLTVAGDTYIKSGSLNVNNDADLGEGLILIGHSSSGGGDSIVQNNNASGNLRLWTGQKNTDIVFWTNYDDGHNVRMVVKNSGSVGIGTTNPTHRLHVNGAVGATEFVTLSDSRFKENVTTLNNSLEKVALLRGVEFEWKKDDLPDEIANKGKEIGLIAQEVEKVLPQLVSTDNKGYKSVQYSNVVAVLIEAVKELKKENEDLKSRVETLEKNMSVQ